MTRKLMIIIMSQRNETALEVQKILTKFGCCIKTRLGLHDVNENYCSATGVIVLDLFAKDEEINDFKYSLDKIMNVKTQIIDIQL